MPCTAGGTPVTIDVLLVLVVLGIEQSAIPTKPAFVNDCIVGNVPLAKPWSIGRIETVDDDDRGRSLRRRIGASVDLYDDVCGLMGSCGLLCQVGLRRIERRARIDCAR